MFFIEWLLVGFFVVFFNSVKDGEEGIVGEKML